jgi:hypothetical protein
MCGIFGFVTNSSSYKEKFLTKTLKELGYLSIRRGKDSSGLCGFNQERNEIDLIKGPLTITELFKNEEVKNSIANWCKKGEGTKFAFGHSRLVTNGTQLDHDNNQPILKDDIICVHNGIVVNVEELWEKYSDLQREFEIDTEVLLSIFKKYLSENYSVEGAISKTISEIFGTVSTALFINDLQKLVLATNNGSLYTISNEKDILFFGSEHYIMSKFEQNVGLDSIGEYQLRQIKPGQGLTIDLDTFSLKEFSLSGSEQGSNNSPNNKSQPVNKKELDTQKDQLSTVMDLNKIHLNPKTDQEIKLLEYPIDEIKKLKRCIKCLLPETFPFIQFDSSGVCNYCNNYTKQNRTNSLEQLEKLVEPYRKAGNQPEVLIPISGGRDSTYVLHAVVKDLGLNAISYTYDWGMVTDLARRNIARVCGKLGVENIIVAADIHWKRKNIKKNIQAWLKNPELGMIPLFMAGDKFFLYHAYKIKKELGIDLEIWGVNDLENTNFKTGFAGLKPEFEKERIYSISLMNKLKLYGFIGKNVIKNPRYINQSVLDSLGSFGARYFMPKADYYHFYDYIRWDEKQIENMLFEEYDWEKAIDTDSTWRIGDGTASFYNYIYTRVAGFSENDTFRSNQIREGMITRDEALDLIYKENAPRYNSLKWYLEIVGLNFEEVIKRINKIPRVF